MLEAYKGIYRVEFDLGAIFITIYVTAKGKEKRAVFEKISIYMKYRGNM